MHIREIQFSARDKVTQKMSKDGLIAENQTQNTKTRISGRIEDITFRDSPTANNPLGRSEQSRQKQNSRAVKRHQVQKKQTYQFQSSNAEITDTVQNSDTVSLTEHEDFRDRPPLLLDSQMYTETHNPHKPMRQSNDFALQENGNDPKLLPDTASSNAKESAINQPTLKQSKQRLLFDNHLNSEHIAVENTSKKFNQQTKMKTLEHKAIQSQNRLMASTDNYLGINRSVESGNRNRLMFDSSRRQTVRGISDIGESAVAGVRNFIHDDSDSDGNSGAYMVDSALVVAQKAVAAPSTVGKIADFGRYRIMRRHQRLTVKSVTNLRFERAMMESPTLRNSGTLHKFFQKRQIKKQYAKALRTGIKTASKASKVKNLFAMGAKVVNVLTTKTKLIAVGVAIAVMMLLSIGSCANSMGGFFQGVGTGVLGGSYLSEHEELLDADLLWTELELDLKEQIENAETNYQGYDEYRYSVDDIDQHDPIKLASLLSALEPYFTFEQMEPIIRDIFEKVYNLELEEETETRTRTILDDFGNEVEEEYKWKILNINLETSAFDEVVEQYLAENEDKWEHYETLNDTEGGGHQMFSSPFSHNWKNNVTSLFGWRTHPITGKKDLHTGLDISAPFGTPILSIMDGKVVKATYNEGGYGWYVDIQDDKGNFSRYAHCSSLSVGVGMNVKKGDEVGKVGSTGASTGNHLHLEIKKNGELQNPIYIVPSNPKKTEGGE